MIKFTNVSKTYEGRQILCDISFEIKQNDFATIIGSSGSGKTTILKMINGLIKADSGTIFVEGENIDTADLIKLRRRIGYVIQSTGLFPHMSVRDNILYVCKLIKMSPKDMQRRIDSLMETVSLERELLSRYPRELSGGQQQRVGIARALAAKPQILLMDEPFAAVDELTRKSLQDETRLIYEKTNTTIVFVTHDIKEAMSLGSRVMIVNSCTIEQFDTPEEIRRAPATDFVQRLTGG
ncbi:MAG: ABC transporter ATP-binding protein [Deferribacteraceae bacterium]|nr:ABC transporter ATP-binding protein [Deferribacteraceae bacterium]